jgi:competence protein ComEC
LNQDHSLVLENLEVVEKEGIVVSELVENNKTNSFIFKFDQNTKVLIQTNKHESYNYGDKVSVSGKFKLPEKFDEDFDYPKYLQKDNILYTSFYPNIKIVEREFQKDLRLYIFKFKKILVKKSKLIFDKQTSDLVLGVLLGVKSSIDAEIKDNFRKSGLIHIVVLSGFNLTIIAYFIYFLLQNFGRKTKYLFSIIFVILFVIMVGAGATVVRAGIMVVLYILGKFFRRNSSPLNALVLAGAVMIYHNPMILLYDPSFQLSFVATLGLVSFYQVIEKFLYFLPEKFAIKEIIVSNISVQIVIIPLLIYLMGEFSVISLIPNILVLPLIPVFMLSAFVAIVLNFLPFIFVTTVFSNLIIFISNYFGSLKFSTIKVEINSVLVLLGIYLLIVLIIFAINLNKKIKEKQKYNYLQS